MSVLLLKKNKILLLFIFITGAAIGLYLWNKIFLPFSNPWNVTGPLSLIKFNPSNNLVRFGVMILIPVLLLVLSYRFGVFKPDTTEIDFTGEEKTFKLRGKFLLLLLMAFIYSVNISTPASFDTFHEGETLGTAVSYYNHKVPYKEFIFCHGLYQDPLRSVIAFDIFGRSIGAVRTLESVTRFLSFLLFAIFLWRLLKVNFLLFSVILAALFSLSICQLFSYFIPKLVYPVVTFNSSRDITLYTFLIGLLYLYDIGKKQNVKLYVFYLVNFLFSFIPVTAFIYSIDRGFYLSATYIIIAPAFYFTFFRRSAYHLHFILSAVGGLLLAVGLVAAVMGEGFISFLEYTFVIMPKYKELLDGYAFPVFAPKDLFFCLLAAANTFWLSIRAIKEYEANGRKFLRSVKSFFKKYLIEFSLLLLSLFFFRSLLGRADAYHLAYSVHISCILSTYILVKHYLGRFEIKKKLQFSLASVAVIFFTFFVFRTYKHDLISNSFPLQVKDEEFIPDSYKDAISFLKSNLTEKETFFTMTSEASWYYFMDRPCPGRFPVVWFAAPEFYQKEVVKDLKKNNVKYVVYKTNSIECYMDGVDHEKRFPIIIQYLKEEYEPLKPFGDLEIWAKKSN